MEDKPPDENSGGIFVNVKVMARRRALLIVDVISDFKFEDGDELYSQARLVVKNIADLKKAYLHDRKTILYVNDNDEGRIANIDQLFEKSATSAKGRSIIDAINPEKERIILKPQRSGFFETDLEERLLRNDISEVVVAGWTTDICVLFTAHDAFMRKFKVIVPADCSAAMKPTHHSDALRFLRRVAEADVSPAFP